ncbi:MAG: protein-disulfide reductase DsbD domain-containing protein [Pseudomonadota bacterium]
MVRMLAVCLSLFAFAGADLRAGEIVDEHVSASFVVRNAVTAPGDTTDIAIRNVLADGWHSYWINPGDSGEPPHIEFDVDDPSSVGVAQFPTPSRMPYPPLINFGYKDEFTLLTSLRVPDDWPAGTPYRVPVRIDWLVCADICIPEGGTTEIEIPTDASSEPDSSVAFTFVQAEWALPEESDVAATYSREADTIYLTAPLGDAEGAVFFPLERGIIDNAAEQTAVAAAEGDGMTLALATGNGTLDGEMRGVLKTKDGAWWITATGDPDEVPVVAALPAGEVPVGSAGTGLTLPNLPEIGPWQAMLFAFLGGLILNLMPCVFPVLALKTLGLVAHADAPLSRRAVIGGAYTAGILTSFAILAAVLVSLKATGVAVGWGFQLQSPTFVAVMAALLFAIGLNLSGIFEIGASLTRLGGRGPQDGAAGSFATGCLATIVATPCTAPFMAVAVGTALAASDFTAIGVFAAMGLGLAAPFVALTLLPGLAKILPKPGVWMTRLKEFLAFFLYATAAWLVWVLAQLVGIDTMLGALVALVLLGLAAWLYGLSQRGSGRSHKTASALAAVAMLAAVLAAWPTVTGTPAGPIASASASDGVPFSPTRLADLRSDGTSVFLNVTAAWCISCKVNERVVFGSSGFRPLLERNDVTFMTADWTRRDPEVSTLLEEFGRAGVPLYVYFPGDGEPQILPQILTLSMLDDAFVGR